MSPTPSAYFREYRRQLGLNNQTQAKQYLAAKDIVPAIDLSYATTLRDRIIDLMKRVDSAIHHSHRVQSIDNFCLNNIESSLRQIVESGLIERLNNQGRRPEQVLFSWPRGWAAQQYFSRSIAVLIGTDESAVRVIGQDDVFSPETFRRSPTADIEIALSEFTIRVEIQSGFQGVNDIKEHKVREARRRFTESRTPTICAHFDLYNGQAALVRLDAVADDDVNWVTRQQMEGQSVFAIDQNSFLWRLLEPSPEPFSILRELELT